MTSWPKTHRITKNYEYWAIDYFGSLYIQGEDRMKVWVCLLTRVKSKSHLEMVDEMTANQFLTLKI